MQTKTYSFTASSFVLKGSTSSTLSEREKKLAIVDDLNKVIDKIDEVLGTQIRIIRGAILSCGWFDKKLADLDNIASNTSEQKNIASYTNILINANIDSCSSYEQSSLRTHRDSLELLVKDYEKILFTAEYGPNVLTTYYSTQNMTLATGE